MSIYTVHEPPQRTGGAATDAERFAFVRDGFSFWAFLLAPLWMLRHQMWLVLAGYVAVAAALAVSVRIFGASGFIVGLIDFLISVLIGLEAATLRRFTLNRRGWKNIGVVSGDSFEGAERRFFDAWVRQAASPASALAAVKPSAAGMPAMPMVHPPQGPDVIGLFPEPGAPR